MRRKKIVNKRVQDILVATIIVIAITLFILAKITYVRNLDVVSILILTALSLYLYLY